MWATPLDFSDSDPFVAADSQLSVEFSESPLGFASKTPFCALFKKGQACYTCTDLRPSLPSLQSKPRSLVPQAAPGMNIVARVSGSLESTDVMRLSC